jgi:hypothetical protein
VSPVTEDKQCAGFQVFTQALGNQRAQAIEAFAQVARLHRHENLQTAGKTQHAGGRPPGFSSARSRAANSGNWFASFRSSRARPGNSNFKPIARRPAAGGLDSTKASNQRTGSAALAGADPPGRL